MTATLTMMDDSVKDRHKGEDIYILSTGPSMGAWSNDELDKHITIGVNGISNKYIPDYFVAVDMNCQDSWFQAKEEIFTLMKLGKGVLFDRRPGHLGLPTWDRVADGQLELGHTVTFCAIHLALIMGAKKIHILGSDLVREGVKEHFYDKVKLSRFQSMESHRHALKEKLLHLVTEEGGNMRDQKYKYMRDAFEHAAGHFNKTYDESCEFINTGVTRLKNWVNRPVVTGGYCYGT